MSNKTPTNAQIAQSLTTSHRVIINTNQIFQELANLRAHAKSLNPNLTLRESFELASKAMIDNYTKFLNEVVECNS